MVYFILAPVTNQIKIGTSDNPRRRLNQLRTGATEDLSLIGVVPGGETTEKRLHAKFRCLRTRGEWFRASDTLLQFIKNLAAARSV